MAFEHQKVLTDLQSSTSLRAIPQHFIRTFLLAPGAYRAAVSVGLSLVAARHVLWVTKATVTTITCRTPSRNVGFVLQVIG